MPRRGGGGRGGGVRHHRVVLGERGGDPRLAPARRPCRHARAGARALVWPFRDPGGEGRARLRLGRWRRPSRRLMLFWPSRTPYCPVAAETGRASCEEGGCQDVSTSVGAGPVKKNK